MSADRVDITTPGGTRIQISSGDQVKVTEAAKQDAPSPNAAATKPKLDALRKTISTQQPPRLLEDHREVIAGVRATDLAKSHEEIEYSDLFDKFTKAELTTVKQAAEQLSQTRVNSEDSNSTVFLEALEVLAIAIKSHFNDDNQNLKDDFSNSSLTKNLGNLYDQGFLDNLMTIRANRIEDSAYKDAATNLLTYLNRTANDQVPARSQEAPF